MGSSYPTTTLPGRFGRPHCDSVGPAHRLCRGRRDRVGHETCSSQRNGATRNRPASRCTSDAPPPDAGTCYCGASSMASASRLRPSAAGGPGAPGGRRAHIARTTHTAHPH
eukprot:3438939-Prymnesium_polylepis.1